jgi:hypothetical protein
VLSGLDLLRRSVPLSSEQREVISIIDASAHCMLRLTNDLLLFSQVSTACEAAVNSGIDCAVCLRDPISDGVG